MTDNQTTESCRNTFETWYTGNDLACRSIERSGEGYRMMQAQQSWTAWQAAWDSFTSPERAESVSEVPEGFMIIPEKEYDRLIRIVTADKQTQATQPERDAVKDTYRKALQDIADGNHSFQNPAGLIARNALKAEQEQGGE